MVLLLSRVYFLDVVFGILDNDFMRLAIKSKNDRNLVPLSVFNPPGLEAKALNVI